MYVAELRTYPGEKKRSGKQGRECIKSVLTHSSGKQLVDHMPRSSSSTHRSVGVSGRVPLCDKAKQGAALAPKNVGTMMVVSFLDCTNIKNVIKDVM